MQACSHNVSTLESMLWDNSETQLSLDDLSVKYPLIILGKRARFTKDFSETIIRAEYDRINADDRRLVVPHTMAFGLIGFVVQTLSAEVNTERFSIKEGLDRIKRYRPGKNISTALAVLGSFLFGCILSSLMHDKCMSSFSLFVVAFSLTQIVGGPLAALVAVIGAGAAHFDNIDGMTCPSGLF